MEFVIRELTGLDLEQGFLETLAHLSPVNLPASEAAKVLQRRLRAGIRTYVAVAHERVIGTAAVFIEPKFIHGGSFVGHIEDVAVHPTAEGKGVGSALVRHLTAECQRLGCYKVLLNCVDARLALYQRVGFRRYEHGMRLDLPIT